MAYSTLRKQDIVPCMVCEDRIPDFDVQKNITVSTTILYLKISGR